MAHLYLLEFFVDSVTVIPAPNDNSGSSKSLIIKMNFDKYQFLVRENLIISNDTIPNDEIEDKKWTRSIRIGKSFLLPSSPLEFSSLLQECTLGIEVWTDDEKEKEIYVGCGEFLFPPQFYFMVQQEAVPCSSVMPSTVKSTIPLYAECCCKLCGEINLIVRLTCLGNSTTVTFQQLMADPKIFLFETDKVDSIYECKRIDKLNQYQIVGGLYPDKKAPWRTIEVCTDVEQCDHGQLCSKIEMETVAANEAAKVKDGKIKMGDIAGLCGNTDCPMAQRIRHYLRQSDAYRKVYEPTKVLKKVSKDKIVCGKCMCKTKHWENIAICREQNRPLLEKEDEDKVAGICTHCGGFVGYEQKNCTERHIEAGGSIIRVYNETPSKNPTVMMCTIDTKLSFRKPFRSEYNNANSALILEKEPQSSSDVIVNDKKDESRLCKCINTQTVLNNNSSCTDQYMLLNELATIASNICIGDLVNKS